MPSRNNTVHGQWYYEDDVPLPICSKCGCISSEEGPICEAYGALMFPFSRNVEGGDSSA